MSLLSFPGGARQIHDPYYGGGRVQFSVGAASPRCIQQIYVDGAGYVEVSDLRDILTMVGNGVAPSNDAVAAKMSFYDLSPKMSIRWDEFLLLMYDRGAVVGEVISQTARTPLLRETPIHH